jgi:hypothetical protein
MNSASVECQVLNSVVQALQPQSVSQHHEAGCFLPQQMLNGKASRER